MADVPVSISSSNAVTRANAAALAATSALRSQRDALHAQITSAQVKVRELSREIHRVEREAFNAAVREG